MAPEDAKEYTSRVLGIHNWRVTEVEKLFEFCNPVKIVPNGQEWLIKFASRANADLSTFVNGAKQNSSKSKTIIEVYVDG